MIRTLRRRFIAIAMLSLLGTLAVLCAAEAAVTIPAVMAAARPRDSSLRNVFFIFCPPFSPVRVFCLYTRRRYHGHYIFSIKRSQWKFFTGSMYNFDDISIRTRKGPADRRVLSLIYI